VPHLLHLVGTAFVGQEISLRRRIYGDHCPCVDIDFLLIDANTGLPVALVEFKQTNSVNLRDANIRAQQRFAAARHLPFFVVRYWKNPWRFQCLLPFGPVMSAPQWIEFLYGLRQQAAALQRKR
jgi:hypothetical protein